jgi:hypothetical protein
LDDAVIEHVRRLELHPYDSGEAVPIFDDALNLLRSIKRGRHQNSQLIDDLRGQEGAIRFGSAFASRTIGTRGEATGM